MDPHRLFHDSTRPAPSIGRRAVVAGTLFLSGCAVAAAAIGTVRHLRPDLAPTVEVLDEKVRHLGAADADYQVVFVGPSRVYRHVDPVTFDARLTELGFGVRSLNLAVPSMSILEADRVLRELERVRPPDLRVVVVDPTFPAFDVRNWATDREMRSHDWRATRFAVSYNLGVATEDRTRILQGAVGASTHALSFLGRAATLGFGARAAFPAVERTPGARSHVMERRGFVALDQEDEPEFAARRQRFLTDLEGEPLSRWLAPPRRVTSLAPTEVAFLRKIVERVAALGAETVFLIGPSMRSRGEMWTFLSERPHHFADTYLLDYVDRNAHRELYDPEVWFDQGHLNSRGARALSARLADDLVALTRCGAGDDHPGCPLPPRPLELGPGGGAPIPAR